MALDGNRWLHVPDGAPAIFDVDLYSVSPMGSWVQVRKRLASEGFEGRTIENAVTIHPSSRLTRQRAMGFAPEVGSCFLKSPEHLPAWLRERIAVLNISDAGTYVPGIGKRWSSILLDRAELPLKIDPAKRWYTVLHGCEGYAYEV